MPESPRMEPDAYEVIEAETAVGAIQKSRWAVGDPARCSRLTAIANSKGTYSVFSAFEKVEEEQNETD